ncbi:hypothetical protein BDV06DRAFT_219300 [Aspergillus oleicola]
MTRKFILHAIEHPIHGLEDILVWHYLPSPGSDSSIPRPNLLRKSIQSALDMIAHHEHTAFQELDHVPPVSAFCDRLSLGAVVLLRKHAGVIPFIWATCLVIGSNTRSFTNWEQETNNVWLCATRGGRDGDESQYFAVKILIGNYSGINEQVDERLQEAVREDQVVTKYCSLSLDHFRIDGPNGSHQCFVYALAGPPLK